MIDPAARAGTAATTPTTPTTPTVLAAWQAALATEYEAVFGYALLGPQLAGTAQLLARRCYDAHRVLRDATTDRVAAAGRSPVAPQADYPALYPVDGAAAAQRLAVRLEDGCAASWRFVYLRVAEQSAGRTGSSSARAVAQRALTASAVRGTTWRQLIDPARATVAFPGIT